MCVVIPSLLSSILDQSMASAKPVNIYMGVDVTAFPITCHVKKTVKQMWLLSDLHFFEKIFCFAFKCTLMQI